MSNIWHSCDTALKNKSNVEINYQINQIELSINQTNQTTKPQNNTSKASCSQMNETTN